jgi:hypothetical protein
MSLLAQRLHRIVVLPAVFLGLPLSAAPAEQTAPGHQHHDHGATPTSAKSTSAKKPRAASGKKATPKHASAADAPRHVHPATSPAGHDGDQHAMKAFLGPYGMTREGSGTSWVPDTTPHEGIHASFGDWSVMTHALFNGVYDKQGGPRGGQKSFANGMIMAMAQRQLGDGTFGLRAMLAPDPFMGAGGYPLLLATGETANGRNTLVDRQHPHDLFMELAATYSYNLSKNSSVFVYAGLPGEPALGPPAFMHRTSGLDIPEAPITHHWLDSTHITFGVVTAGFVSDNWKIEASAFRGREPDQHRFDIEAPKFDSVSTRLTWNPVRELSLQVSVGRLHSPEQLEPNVDEDRLTASAIYTQPFGDNNVWSTTFAWGRKIQRPGGTLDGFMLESALILQKTYTLFARAERVEENELFNDVPPLAGRVFTVNKLSLGAIYDIALDQHTKVGVGGLISRYGLSSATTPFYGSSPTSFMLFARVKVQ